MSEIETYLSTYINLGISAHNSQPFLFSFSSSEKVSISVNLQRKLPYADPHEKDLQMSLGATVETLQILLKSAGSEISKIQLTETPGCAEIYYQKSQTTEKSAFDLLQKRFSYRGAFDGTPAPQVQNESSLRFTNDKGLIGKVAKLYDDVNYSFIKKPGYLQELYSWLRFNKSNPRWSSDGLNAEAMALGPIESFGGSFVMKPSIFSFLDQFGLGKMMIEEGPKIKSAPYLVAIYSEKKLSPFEQGRLFLQSWLRLTELGLYGSPLSLITDDPKATQSVLEWLSLPPSCTLVNILRAGALPKNFKPYPRARLNFSETQHV